MSEQWPVPRAAAEHPAPVGLGGPGNKNLPPVGLGGPGNKDDAQPLLPLAFAEHVELIRASPAIAAFARKRATQILTHGHSPEADLAQPPAYLAKQAKDRLHAFLEFMPMQRMNLPRERREQLLRYVEVSGACLLALWDRLQVEVPDE